VQKQILYTILIAVLVSCSPKAYFTSEIRAKAEAKQIDMKQLQYYIDSDLELIREVKNDTAKVSSGRIIFSNGKYLQIITLKANTKGVCTNVYPNRLNIAFEDGDNRFITFGISKFSNQFGKPYELYFSDAKGTTPNTILYEGQLYTININQKLPKLQIIKSEIDKKDTKKRNMKGRKVSGKKVEK
jgi:hypothetical protein